MAMPKKGLRKIIVKGAPYLWAASEKWHRTSSHVPVPPTASSEIHLWYCYRLLVTVTVQCAADDRIRLFARAEFPNTIVIDDYPEGGAVRPRHVAALISNAQVAGRLGG